MRGWITTPSRKKTSPVRQPDHPATARPAAAYLRGATTDTGPPTGLTAQREAITAYADRNDLVLVASYEDVASGATVERPGLHDVLMGAERGDFEVLIVHSVDRLARNVLDTWLLMEQLGAAGIELRSTNDAVDLTSAAGRALIALGPIISLERDLLSRRARQAHALKRARSVEAGE